MKMQLKARFEPVTSKTSLSLFVLLLDYVERFDKNDDNVICYFPHDLIPHLPKKAAKLIIRSPLSEVQLEKVKGRVPDSYFSFLSVCGGMLFGERGETSQLVLSPGFEGSTMHTIGEDAMADYTGEEISPIDCGMDSFYFYKPGNFDQLFISDEGLAVVTLGNDPVEIYLRELHYEFHDVSKDNFFKTAQHRHTWLKACH